ncbi:nesprin-2-like [Phycodurus eques]|uniref:nesprin-2-like n=1 Tax=Phycodurus eques TaxID=693459 RepID=UPI002ACDDDDE|nr:nesprin-2-like [Phycodurus eques]
MRQVCRSGSVQDPRKGRPLAGRDREGPLPDALLRAGGEEERVTQQPVACQEMLSELERKASVLPESGPASPSDQDVPLGRGDGRAVEAAERDGGVGRSGDGRSLTRDGEEEAAELLRSKLELVHFQKLPQAKQETVQEVELPRATRLWLQEPSPSSGGKLLRPSGPQRQEELERQLSEQRGLTRAVAGLGRGAEEAPASPWRSPAEDAAAEWSGLRRGLLELEDGWRRPADSQVTKSSGADEAGGFLIASDNLEEPRARVGRLRESERLAERWEDEEEDPRGGEETAAHCEHLARSLTSLAGVGRERLARSPRLRTATGLSQQLAAHTKFFHFLHQHLHVLHFLSCRVPESTLHGWEGAIRALQEEMLSLQTQALHTGVRMEEILQRWREWEEDAARCQSLLTSVETALYGGRVCAPASQDASCILDENAAQLGCTLEAGLWLQQAGCTRVGVACRDLEARWTQLNKTFKRQNAHMERKTKLSHSFTRDSTALTEWMGVARELIDRWRLLMVSATEDAAGGEQRREEYCRFVALIKDLEDQSRLKEAVTSQLGELRGIDRDLGEDPEDGPSMCETSDQDLDCMSERLGRLERDWSSLLADVPTVQNALHKWWMETLSQQEALQELQAWLTDSESRLEERRRSVGRNSCTAADLRLLLKYYKECCAEMSVHRATLDHATQPWQTCSTGKGPGGRYDANRLAEDQGSLKRRWLMMQTTLDVQIGELEEDLRVRTEQEVGLEHIDAWMVDQKQSLDSTRAPRSLADLQRDPHQDLDEQIQMRQVALQKLADQHGRRGGGRAFRCHIDQSRAVCVELAQQNKAVTSHLMATRQLWLSLDMKVDDMTQRRVRTSQMLDLLRGQSLSLQAHKDLQCQLQSLHEDMKASESDWDRLHQTFAALKDRVHPDAANMLTQRIDTQTHSWSVVRSCLDQHLQRSLVRQTVWEVHTRSVAVLWERVKELKRDAASVPNWDGATCQHLDDLNQDLQKLQTLQERADSLQCDLQGVLEASKDLIGRLEPSVAALVQSESRLLSRAALRLGRTLAEKRDELQEELQTLQEVSSLLDTLEATLETWMERLEHPVQHIVEQNAVEQNAVEQRVLLDPSALAADLDILNELSRGLTLNDGVARRLRRLNRRWSDASARAQEACSELQTEALRHQSFEQKCESWMSFLQRMEERVAVDVSGSYAGLRQQLCAHKRFQAEMSMGHQMLHSVISDALRLLQRGDVDDRSDFILKLTQLREQWRGAAQGAERQRSLVEGLVQRWHQYHRGLRKLQRFLAHTQNLLPGAGPGGLRILRLSLRQLQHTQLLFRRHQSSFIHTLELGRQLFSAAGEQDAQDAIQAELATLQDDWERLHGALTRCLDLTQAVVENWDRCEAGLEDKMLLLKDMKNRLNQAMPECSTHGDQEKEEDGLEDALRDWAHSLSQLSAMKTDLSQYVMADDVLVLHERVRHLDCHWEELCLKVSLRKQEIGDRLNAWMMFKEKNAELCDWLTHMENKMANESHLNIEEMVEKLKKDCMEEMNLFSENKSHLKQLGEQIIDASNKTKESDVNDTLYHVNDRWQHLFHHIEARVRKLKETLGTVQQLDNNMNELRTWLARVDAQLAQPPVYHVCHADDIHDKLERQQEVQRDIDDHAATVASVARSCDVLLRDADACGGESERDAILQAASNLDRRWRNICAMALERRMRIEETWRLWCKFLDDLARFEDWLKVAELTAANPDSADVLYTSAKEELKKFEAFQRQVHERLTQMELVNKQYRRLARENRTDAAGDLRLRVDRGNRRWDGLRRRVAAVLRRLKHFTSQREDFEGTREGILMWLTEMDLQLTDVEHFSESDMEDKMRQMKAFQHEITLNANKIDALIVFGENLIQKSAPLDAALIEEELEELHSYCQEVFGRVARFHHRLVCRRPVEVLEEELSDQENPAEASGAVSSWSDSFKKDAAERQTSCQLLVPPLEHSGRETPVSVDSIPLEWDHTVDVGGSSSHEDDEDTEDVAFFSTLSVKSASDTPSWHRPASPLRTALSRHVCSTSIHQQGYVKLMSECSGSIDDVKRVKLLLDDEQKVEGPLLANLPGLTSGTTPKHTGTGVIERWEVVQAQKVQQETEVHQNPQQWHQFSTDLSDVTSWLNRNLPDLEALQTIPPSTGVRHFEDNVRTLKEMQRAFCLHKRSMISVNLASRHFLLAGRDDDSEQLKQLKVGLSSANHSWMRACRALERWEAGLHAALIQCQEFHESLHSLLLWLAQVEQKLSEISERRLSPSYAALLEQRDELQGLQEGLQERQEAVASLHAVGTQLLLEAGRDHEDCVQAKEKVHVVSNKMKLLLRHVHERLSDLNQDLNTLKHHKEEEEPIDDPQSDVGRRYRAEVAEVAAPSRRRHLLYRVVRAAFPLHVLLALVLALACFVAAPAQEPSYYSCSLTNNFARSFYPMLRYTNGPPPT